MAATEGLLLHSVNGRMELLLRNSYIRSKLPDTNVMLIGRAEWREKFQCQLQNNLMKQGLALYVGFWKLAQKLAQLFQAVASRKDGGSNCIFQFVQELNRARKSLLNK